MKPFISVYLDVKFKEYKIISTVVSGRNKISLTLTALRLYTFLPTTAVHFAFLPTTAVHFAFLPTTAVHFTFLPTTAFHFTFLPTKENRIYIRGKFRESLGINFFSPLHPEREFKNDRCSFSKSSKRVVVFKNDHFFSENETIVFENETKNDRLTIV